MGRYKVKVESIDYYEFLTEADSKEDAEKQIEEEIANIGVNLEDHLVGGTLNFEAEEV